MHGPLEAVFLSKALRVLKNIGGGFAEGDLAKVALAWMVGQAEAAGVQMGAIDNTIIANPVIHDKSKNLGKKPDPTDIYSFEDRVVRRMNGTSTSQVDLTGTVMTTSDTYPFINNAMGPDYKSGTVDMAGYLQWLNGNGYGINLTIK